MSDRLQLPPKESSTSTQSSLHSLFDVHSLTLWCLISHQKHSSVPQMFTKGSYDASAKGLAVPALVWKIRKDLGGGA